MQVIQTKHILVWLLRKRNDGSIFTAHNFYLLIWKIVSYPWLSPPSLFSTMTLEPFKQQQFLYKSV